MSKKYFTLFFVSFLTFVFCPSVFAKYPAVQNERLVMNALRKVYDAEVQYQSTVGAGGFGTLTQLRQVNLIDDALASGQKYGYYFTINTVAPVVTIPGRFYLTAVPRIYRKTGIRSFYIDHRCTLRGADKNGGAATLNDAAIEPCVPAMITQNEALVMQALRNLHSAQMSYQATTGNGYFGTLASLMQAGLIDIYLATGNYRGYTFDCAAASGTSSFPPSFQSRAVPNSYGETGFRSFYIDTSGVLRGADKHGLYPDGTEPPVESFSENN
jgi:hypothetical protein